MTELNDIVEAFEILGDWESRYQYLIELGENLPNMPEANRTGDRRVKACMSKVWIRAYPDPVGSDRVCFEGECDTAVIKGVLALLIKLASGKTVQEIRQLDLDEVFEHLNLGEHLSPNRHVGVYAIVDLMKQQAEALFAQQSRLASA
ncbi:MAG: SufE family protein [Gammaproteobacteria bacterium]|nr:SufE family protein [Gammaproteobacteria bacterium]NNJ95204.1 SufE family protein [Halobacteria archaeon]